LAPFKGAFLGIWLFGIGTMAFLYFAIYRNLPPHSAVGVSVVTGYASQNPWWWTAAAQGLFLLRGSPYFSFSHTN